jgi:hypothetical protein
MIKQDLLKNELSMYERFIVWLEKINLGAYKISQNRFKKGEENEKR